MGNMLKYEDKLNVLGDTIKYYRLQKGLSLEKLSNKLQLIGINLPAPSIYKIENNLRSIKDYELIGLSEVLSFSIDDEVSNFKNSIK